jgi:WD40 repeat protein
MKRLMLFTIILWFCFGSHASAVVVHQAQAAAPTFQIAHPDIVNSVAISRDGRTVASGCADKLIRLWDVETGKLIRELSGHGNAVSSLAFSPDDQTLASGSSDKTLRLWNVKTGALIRELQGFGGSSIAFSPDGKMLAGDGANNAVNLWDTQTGNIVRAIPGPNNIVGVAFSPDGTLVAGSELTLLLSRMTITFSTDPSQSGISVPVKPAKVNLWEVQTGKRKKVLKGPSQPGRSIAFSPDGNWMAGSGIERVVLWDIKKGDYARSFDEYKGTIYGVGYSADGRLLVSGDKIGTVTVWNTATGEVFRSLSGHTGPVQSVAISADGRTVASGGDDKTLRIWLLK